MKNGSFIILLPFLWMTTPFASAADTNMYPTTQTCEGAITRGPSKMGRESFPANDFPDGNWGNVVNGCQVSLRFEKRTYTNGEPITAIILLRNVTNKISIFPLIAGAGGGCQPIDLLITSEAGKPVPEDQLFVVNLNGLDYLKPCTQHKYLELLNRGHHLTSGVYFVCVDTKVALRKFVDGNGNPINSDWKEIKSAAVRIKIEDPPAGPKK